MKCLITSIVLLFLCLTGFATTVTVNAASTGYATTSAKTSGTMTVSNSANRGYAVFNLSSAGIPAAATITSVKLVFTYTISGSGTPTDNIYGYVGDISSLSASSLYSGAVTSNHLYTSSWGTSRTTKTMSSTTNAVTFLQSNHTNTVSMTWVESASTRVYTITGGSSPHLVVTYTCATPSGVSITASSNPICSGNSETLTGHASGATSYTWAGPNSFSSTSLSPSAFTTSTLTAGVYTLTATSTCAISVAATYSLTVKSAPVAISGASSVCVGATTTLTDATPGGTWSSNSTSRATVTSSGVVTGVSAGTVNITYLTGCGTAAAQVMTVKGTPSAIAGTPNVCIGNTTTLTDATSGGTWSSSNTAVASVSASGVVSGISGGTATITYNNGGCGIATATSTVATAPASISGSSTVCTGLTTALSNSVSGGTWSSSSTGRATVVAATGVVTGVSAGSVNITYTTGCGSNAVLGMTVSASPSAIGGATSVCSGSTTTLTDATTLGTWSSSNTSLATVTSGGVVTGVAQGAVTISYTKSGCSALNLFTVKTNPGAISGASAICTGTTSTLANSTLSGTWSSSNTAIATVVAATGVVSGVSNGSFTITYSTGCGSNATRSESVVSTPAAITGTTTVCQSATTTLHDATGSGSWSSSDATIATVNSSTGVVGGVGQGTATITYGLSGCYSTTTATVTGIPTSITGSTNICNGASGTLADAIVSGSWSSSNTAIASVDPVSGTVTGVAVGSANISYSTGCGSAAVAAVNINTVPTVITGAASLCTGTPTALSADLSAGSWSSDNTAIATVDASGNVNGVNEGSANILYTLTNGCGTTVLSSPMAVTVTGKWNGSSSTDWNDAGNWPCGTIPDATTNVIIPAGTTFLPDFSGTSFPVKNFTVASGAHISISGDAYIDVKGNFTNNGIIDGDGYVNLSNSSASQTIYGKGYISNLTINNSHGAVMNSGDSAYVTDQLTVTSGTLTANSGIVLISNNLATATVAPLTSGSISGNVTVQQYVQGGRRAYRFFGHPFSSAIPLSQLENSIDITGQGGSVNGFTNTNTNTASCFWYNTTVGNSANAYDPGWQAFTATSTAVDANKFKQYEGIRLFIRGAKGEGLTASAYSPSAVTVSMCGPLNTGNQTITMHKGTNSDYNQLSNPYPSPTDIGTVIANAQTAGHITGSAFYVWNPFLGSAGAYEAKPIGSAYILAPNSSFQVRAASEGATLSFTESNKASTPDEALLRTATPDQFITLNVYDAAGNAWDMARISFNSNATNNEDSRYDAVKMHNPDLNFYSLSADNAKLCIDARPYATGTIIPLGFSTVYAQQYVIKAENMVLPTGGQLYLHDKYLGVYTALETGAAYKFNVTTDAASQGEQRFELTTTQGAATAAMVTNGFNISMSPNPATDQVTISFTATEQAATSVRILNVSGASVLSNDLGNVQNGSVNLSLNTLPAGIYMVEVTSGDHKTIQKLIKD